MNKPFRVTCLVNIFVLFAVCATWVKADDSVEQEQVIQEFDVPKGVDFLVIPVTIEGKRFPFVLDSGATVSVFDKSLRDYLGKFLNREELGIASGEQLTVDIVESPRASVGKLLLPEGTPVALADFAWLRRLTESKIYGMLGMDFLSTRVVRVNFDEGKVTFLRGIGDDAGRQIALNYDQAKIPYVLNVIPGWKSEAFQIDTGFRRSGQVRRELYSALAAQGRIHSSGLVPYADLGGQGSTNIGRLDMIKIGEFEKESVFFLAGGKNKLGLGFLSRFIVTFDFPNEKMYLKPGKEFGSPHQTWARRGR